MPRRVWIGVGALSGLIGVIMAALGAHATAHLDPSAQRMLQSAVQMQMWHALALIGCGAWAPQCGRLAHLAGAAFVAGSLLFCGPVYALAFSGHSLGALAPIGGSVLMLGWLLLALSALPLRRFGK